MTTTRRSTATPRKDPATGLWGFVFESEHPGPGGAYTGFMWARQYVMLRSSLLGFDEEHR